MTLTAPGQPQASNYCAIYAPHPANVSAGVSLIGLPVDILVSVLGHLSLDELIKATHICSYWRSAALDSPALWASSVHIAGFRPALLEEILRRSKAAPLDISLTDVYASDPHDVEDYISSVTQRMSQVRRLHLSPPSGWRPWSLRLSTRIHLDLSRGAPLLRSLLIDFGTSFTISVPNWTLSISLPTRVHNACSIPHRFTDLRHIHLHRIGHPEHLEALLALNPLHSLDIQVPSTYQLSTILSLIQASPDLRNLTLEFGYEFRDVSSHLWNGPVMARSMDNLVMSYVSGAGTFATRTILSALDTALIRRICLTNGTKPASEMDHLEILSAMVRPIRLDFLLQSLHVESPRGFVRRFVGNGLRLFDPLPLLRFVVTLTLPITACWDHISESLVFLEHLTLVGSPEDLTSAATTPKIHPRLRTVTLWLWLDNLGTGENQWGYSLSETLGTFIAFVAVRISGYARPLERLTLLVESHFDRQYLVRHTAIPAALVEVRHQFADSSEPSWFPRYTEQGYMYDDMDDGDAEPGVKGPR